MNNYVIIAGADGTGKSSLRGVLEGQNVLLGHIIDANAIAKENNFDNIIFPLMMLNADMKSV